MLEYEVLGALIGKACVQFPAESAKAQNMLQLMESKTVPATVVGGKLEKGAVIAMRSVPLPEMRNRSELT